MACCAIGSRLWDALRTVWKKDWCSSLAANCKRLLETKENCYFFWCFWWNCKYYQNQWGRWCIHSYWNTKLCSQGNGFTNHSSFFHILCIRVLVVARTGLIFCRSWKGVWLRQGSNSVPAHIIAGEWRKRTLFWVQYCLWLGVSHVNLFFFYTFCY